MDVSTAVISLAALAQETRLQLFRRLVKQGPAGLCAGEIGEQMGIPAATLSFHLKELCQAGLLTAERQGRHIYYAPDFAVMNDLVDYLTENCCSGTACDTRCAPASRATPTKRGKKR